MDLSNLHVIKSVSYPDSLDMGNDGNEDSNIIVSNKLIQHD